VSKNENPTTAPTPAQAEEDRIAAIITRALLEGCDNHKTRAQIARETARQVMGAAPRQNDFLRRMAIFFDRDATAGPFCAEDGDGGFVASAERMAREIDRLRATLSAASNAPMDAVGLAQDEVELSGISGELNHE